MSSNGGIFQRLGILHIVCGSLDVIIQTAALIIATRGDGYVLTTVLRNYYVFLASPGIWVGVITIITGIVGIIVKQQFEYTHTSGRIRTTVSRSANPRAMEALSACSVISCIFNAAMLTIHSYILWLLMRFFRIRKGSNLDYDPTYWLHLVLLSVISVSLLVIGFVDLVAHLAGTVFSCRYVQRGWRENRRAAGSVTTKPLMNRRGENVAVYSK